MRMSTFVVGGIVGATVAMYMTQNNRQSFMKSMNKAGSNMSKFINLGKDSKSQNLDQVEKMVNEDPVVKQSVDEILAANAQNTFTQTQ